MTRLLPEREDVEEIMGDTEDTPVRQIELFLPYRKTCPIT